MERDNNQDPPGPGIVNSKGPGSSRNWSFTVDNWDKETHQSAPGFSTLNPKGAVWRLEKGESGLIHLQCFICWNNSKTWSATKNLLLSVLGDKYPNNLQVARNPAAAAMYCITKNKKGEFLSDPFIYGDIPKLTNKRKSPENSSIKDYYLLPAPKWQQFVLDLYEQEPDNRTIYWLYDKVGATGKTMLARHLCIKHPKEVLYLNGKASDMKFAVAKAVEANQNLRMVICNIPRTQAELGLPTLLNGIEQLKDGIFFSGKYESGMVLTNYFHLLVLSNEAPDYASLSRDRWYVREIKDGDLYECVFNRNVFHL